MGYFVELQHPTDPRYLMIEGEPPDTITIDDLADTKYGKLMIYRAHEPDFTYSTDKPGKWTLVKEEE